MDGYVYGYRYRSHYTNLAVKRGKFERCIVFCPDFHKRKIVGHSDVRLESPLWTVLLLNGFYSGIPILSEPIGSYEFRELKLLVAKAVHRRRHSLAIGGPELRIQLEQAENFDDLLDIVYPDPKATKKDA